MRKTNFCPCGSSRLLSECCGRYFSGEQIPQTPEQLMRSRYSAYVEGNLDYLRQTSQQKDDFDEAGIRSWLSTLRFEGLTVRHSELDPNDPQTGYVSFTAVYKSKGRRYQMREKSRFIQEKGRWVYVDGEDDPAHHCGSGCHH